MARKHGKDQGIEEFPKSSGRWRAVYADGDGNMRREMVGPKGLAKELYRKRKTEVREGRFFPKPRKPRRVPVSECLDDYLCRSRAQKLRSIKDIARHCRFWDDVFNDALVTEIIPADIEHAIEEHFEEAADATVNNYLRSLKAALNVAIDNDKLQSNPVRRIKMRKLNNARTRHLLPEEEDALRLSLPPEALPIFDIALYTGARRGELFNIKWEHVDFDRKIITIPRSKHGQVRYITMHSLVVEHLLALADGATSEWVFPSQTGKTPLGAQNFVNRVYNPSVARAEIDDFHFHDLRHTFASRLVMSGVGLYTVKELMGHRTIEMTMRYSHLSSGHLQEAVERLALPRT